jgi:hypothetical protein
MMFSYLPELTKPKFTRFQAAALWLIALSQVPATMGLVDDLKAAEAGFRSVFRKRSGDVPLYVEIRRTVAAV